MIRVISVEAAEIIVQIPEEEYDNFLKWLDRRRLDFEGWYYDEETKTHYGSVIPDKTIWCMTYFCWDCPEVIQ